jgi:hypothetical protein
MTVILCPEIVSVTSTVESLLSYDDASAILFPIHRTGSTTLIGYRGPPL